MSYAQFIRILSKNETAAALRSRGLIAIFRLTAFGIDDIAPIKVAAVKAKDQHFRSCRIGGNRDVMHIAQACQRMYIRLIFAV